VEFLVLNCLLAGLGSLGQSHLEAGVSAEGEAFGRSVGPEVYTPKILGFQRNFKTFLLQFV